MLVAIFTCTLYTARKIVYIYETQANIIVYLTFLCTGQRRCWMACLNSEEVIINEKSWKHSQRCLHLCKHEYLMCISGTKASLTISGSGFHVMLFYFGISDSVFIITDLSLLYCRLLQKNRKIKSRYLHKIFSLNVVLNIPRHRTNAIKWRRRWLHR